MSKPIPPELEERAKFVVAKFASAKSRHEAHRKRWEGYYAQYRSYVDLKRQHGQARTPNDVDAVLSSARSTYDEQLFIPYAFATIETVLPRMLAQPPKIGVRAKREEWSDLAEPIALHIDTQQDEGDYELCLQDVAKSGLMYGLGVQKLTHRHDVRVSPVLRERRFKVPGMNPYVKDQQEEVVFSGPQAECVDIFDWIWDPLAYSMATLSWCIHRTWRDDAYLERMFKEKVWALPPGWEAEDAKRLASTNRHSEVWGERDAASGAGKDQQAESAVHEVWEFHDGEKVCIVLDQQLVVAEGPNPYWHGQIPFQIYRPTRVMHEMVGIGEIEAITALIDEMNTLRTQRRDNAALVLQRPFAYFDGLVDPADIAFGPGIGIPVEGDPREVIFPFPVQDIPNSGYMEENGLKADIERVTGLDDSLAGASGGGGATETATGVQMVQAAANVRIKNKTRLLQKETVRPAARQWFRLNRQFVREPIEVIGPPRDGDPGAEYAYYTVGPEHYAGEFFVSPDDGSMEPENLPAKRQNAQQMMAAFTNNPAVDQRKLAEWALDESGVPNAAGFLAPEEPAVPLHALDQVREALAELVQVDPQALAGILQDPRQFDQLLQGAAASVEQPQEQQGAAPQAQLPPPGE